jgi:hypothetical protein
MDLSVSDSIVVKETLTWTSQVKDARSRDGSFLRAENFLSFIT